MNAAIVLLALAGMGTATLALLAYRRAQRLETVLEKLADVLAKSPCFRAALLEQLMATGTPLGPLSSMVAAQQQPNRSAN